MTSIREDRLSKAILSELRNMQLSSEGVAKLRAQWESGPMLDDLNAKRRSVAAKIEDRQSKLDRLTDLLVEGAIDQKTYTAKKRELGFELSKLQGQLDDLPNPRDIKCDREDYVRQMSNLEKHFLAGNRFEKREMLRNTFSQRTAGRTNVFLTSRSWVGTYCEISDREGIRRTTACSDT